MVKMSVGNANLQYLISDKNYARQNQGDHGGVLPGVWL